MVARDRIIETCSVHFPRTGARTRQGGGGATRISATLFHHLPSRSILRNPSLGLDHPHTQPQTPPAHNMTLNATHPKCLPTHHPMHPNPHRLTANQPTPNPPPTNHRDQVQSSSRASPSLCLSAWYFWARHRPPPCHGGSARTPPASPRLLFGYDTMRHDTRTPLSPHPLARPSPWSEESELNGFRLFNLEQPSPEACIGQSSELSAC